MDELNLDNLNTTANISDYDGEIRSFCIMSRHYDVHVSLEDITKRAAVITLITLGLLGSIFVIVLAVKYTTRKNMNNLIINVAVADVVFILMKVTLLSDWLWDQKWYSKDNIQCKLDDFVVEISYRVPLFTLLVISSERFRATRQTLLRSKPYTRKKSVAVLSVCWLIPMAMEAYILYYNKIDDELELCFTFGLGYHYFQYANTFSNVMVLIVLFTLNIFTIKRLSKSNAIHVHLSQEQRTIRARRTKSAVRMVLISVLLYTICWFPKYILMCIEMVNMYTTPVFDKYMMGNCMGWRRLGFMVNVFLPLTNSCFSPFIYIIFLSDFREAAKKVLCACVEKKGRLEKRSNLTELRSIPKLNGRYLS